jgi:hypothetical protein
MPTLKDINSGYASSKLVAYNLRLFCDNEFEQIFRVYRDDMKAVEADSGAEVAFRKVNAKWGRHGDFELVGLEEPTNKSCGTRSHLEGCLNVKGHVNTLTGNFSGKAYVYVASYHCNKPSCRVCYKFGWASREARKAAKRLEFASKQFGKIEHGILNVPFSSYDLSYEKLHAEALKIAYKRGWIGGLIIFHAFRYHGFREWQCLNTSDESLGWYFAPHWHLVGFLKVSYMQCRGCPDFVQWFAHGGVNSGCNRVCHCDGFEQTTREQYKTDFYICKIEGERKTVVGTIFYQLGHSSIKSSSLKVGGKRFYPLTWFGVAGYHKLHFKPEKDTRVCPLCGLPLVKISQCGCSGVKICTDESSPDFHRHLFLDMYDEFGANLFVKDSAGDLR